MKLTLLLILLCCSNVPAKPLHHYVFFGMDREEIKNKVFLETEAFEGAQVAYSWNQLETGKDAVQDGNYEYINPQTNKRVTIPELIAFATNYLKADYGFWCTEDPYFTNEVIPFFKERRP